jgi:hypothetical protein
VRLFAKENGYLKFWSRLLESVLGGHIESGFWPSSAGLAGPASLLLRSDAATSAPTTFCNAAKLPITCPTDGREPHGCARKIDMVKDNGTACDHRGHPRNPTEKKVERNLPSPNRRFDHRLTVVTWFSRNWTACNIDTAAGHDAFSPSFLAQLFESLFRRRISRHEKNAKARSVPMIDAIAVAKAEVHADFK